MSVFVDTSFFIALLDEDDQRSTTAGGLWRAAAAAHAGVFTTNYVVLESCAVLQRRLGIAAVRRLTRDLLTPVQIEWVTRTDHGRAVDALITAARRDLSLVDCVSFVVMRRLDISECLAFDHHFDEQGFTPPVFG
jgi:predicted nucleic acid-binding protein